jgi:hypothetical protein
MNHKHPKLLHQLPLSPKPYLQCVSVLIKGSQAAQGDHAACGAHLSNACCAQALTGCICCLAGITLIAVGLQSRTPPAAAAAAAAANSEQLTASVGLQQQQQQLK